MTPSADARQQKICKDARAIYAAVSRQAAEEALRSLAQTWAEYPAAVRVRTDNFEHVERLFELPAHIRRMVYTTIMIEGFHSALRKVTRGKAAFPDGRGFLRALSAHDGRDKKMGCRFPIGRRCSDRSFCYSRIRPFEEGKGGVYTKNLT
jgi:transposase-like protein